MHGGQFARRSYRQHFRRLRRGRAVSAGPAGHQYGQPEVTRYGFSNKDVFAVGLTCGGEIEVFVQRIDAGDLPELEQVALLLNEQRPVAIATVIDAQTYDPRAARRRASCDVA